MIIAPDDLRAHRRVRVTPFGPSAIHTLHAAVAEVQAIDPLAPVTVVTPGGSGGCAGLHARRCLTLDPERGGLANIRFMSLSRLAELQGEVDLAREGKLPLNEALRLEFLRRSLLGATANPLRVHADNPATFQTLGDAFAELDELSPEEQDVFRAGSSAVAAATVQIFDAYKAEIAKSAFYDEPDAMQAAAQAIRTGRADGAIGVVILYLPNGVLKCEIDLLRALNGSGRLRIVVGLVGEATADAETLTLLEALGLTEHIRESIAPAINPESAVMIVVDAEEEVRAAIADLRRRLIEDGTPLWRMAFLYRVGDPYAAICAERLCAAGLPFFARSPRTLAQSVPGRILSGFLHARRENFSATSVREWLRSAQIYSLDAGEGNTATSRRRLPVDVVEKIVRRFGALRGIESWVKTIDRMIAARERALKTPVDSSLSPDDYQIRGLRQIGAFLQRAAHDDAHYHGTWAGYSKWCNEALIRLVGENTKDRYFNEEDEDALVSIGELIRSLGTLDAVRDGSLGSAVTTEAFVSAVDQILATAVKDPEAHYGRGVFVGSLDDAYSLDFEHVFLLGTHDGALPPPIRSNPLLSSVGSASIAREAADSARERRAYLVATRCAPSITYLYARADRRAGRPQMPSRCLLREMASMNAGQPVSSEMISGPKQIVAPWITRWRSFDAAAGSRFARRVCSAPMRGFSQSTSRKTA